MMNIRMNKIGLIMLGLFLILSSNVAQGQNPCPFKAPVGEAGLRKYKTIKKAKPVYPDESLKNKVKGTVIAEILINENGKVVKAEVKEAPDEFLKKSVIDAAKQWEFSAPPKVQGKQICFESTLSFKFEIENGKGKVSDAPVN